MVRSSSHVGLTEWFRAIVLHRCPRCGTRLVRHVAVEEGYTITEGEPISPSIGKFPGTRVSHGMLRKRTRTPVYLECSKCEFRVHLKDIES